MRLTNLTVQNYKSLKNLTFTPSQMSVIVGANAAGKSNLADCIDFISEVYEHGLEVAVSRKGGYENIAFRRVRRSKKPIEISLCVELAMPDLRHYTRRSKRSDFKMMFEHSFSFVARGYSIRADFEVVRERLIVKAWRDDTWAHVATIRRTSEKYDVHFDPEFFPQDDGESRAAFGDEPFDLSILGYIGGRSDQSLPSTELFTNTVGRVSFTIATFMQTIQSLRVFQISPTESREFGVPTPQPELDRWGGNLPAVIDVMQKRNEHEWDLVMQSMRSILPELRTIEADYTPSRTLGLYFKERGTGKPWSVDEISDGTR